MSERREPRKHFSGGVRTLEFKVLPGGPVCTSGDAARRIVAAGHITDDANEVTCRRCMDVLDKVIGGPVTCTRECSECGPKSPRATFFELHHFADIVESIEDDPNHPAATLYGRTAWYRCKHCPAWALDETEAWR